MTQIAPGLLRAYLDDDPALDAATRARIAAAVAADPDTATCLDAVRATREAVTDAFAPLAPLVPSAAVERAYYRVRNAAGSAPTPGFIATMKEYLDAMITGRSPLSTGARRFALLGSVGAVALVLLITFAPVGNIVSAALDQFRYQPDKFAVITLRQSDFGGASGAMAMKPTGAKPGGTPGATKTQDPGALAKYVTVTSSLKQGQMPARPVKTAADAQAATGRAVAVPTIPLPAGVPTQPLYFVSDAQKADATIDLKDLRPALATSGMDGLLPPTGDTATVHVDIPTASIVSYGVNPATFSMTGKAPAQKGIVVATMGTPSVDVQGLDVHALANTLASMPGVPPQVQAQLRSADFNHTLVVPVTDDQTVKNGTFIHGNASTLIAQKDGSGAVALWFNRGILYVVAGTYDGATIEKVAQSVT